jgi:hypothetical protein
VPERRLTEEQLGKLGFVQTLGRVSTVYQNDDLVAALSQTSAGCE